MTETATLAPKAKQNALDAALSGEVPFLPPTSLFPRGEMVYSRGVKSRHVKDKQFKQFLYRSLIRHLCGDWGDVCGCDLETNAENLESGEPLVSFYQCGYDPDLSVYIITDGDRGATRVGFADDLTTEMAEVLFG